MCGIAGIWRFDGAPVEPARVRRMAAAMRHRGPDDEGYVALDPVGESPPLPLGGPRTAPEARGAPFPYAAPAADPEPVANRALVIGQVRLAIIDLSPGGHQPLCNEDGTIWVTYGGEIFNYRELRDELAARGYRFRSACDTEVLVHGYVEWGEDLFRHLNGMWGLALWDGRRRRLICARDRMGVKPFYYRYAASEFAFASEMSGLLALGLPPEPDRGAVRRLIAAGRVDTGEGTFFTGIRSLPPAHYGVVGEQGLALTRFWELPGAESGPAPADAAAELRQLLTDSVRLRLRSDVPVGSCLSGGIDSSTIVALGTQLLGAPMDAYSVAYDEGPEFDERQHMRAVCEATSARHHLVMPRGEALLDELAVVTRAQGEPTAGPGVYSQWHVMRLAGGNRAKVLLDGQGADELFGGYFAFYFPHRLRDLLARGELAGAADLARAALARGHSPLEVAARVAEPWIPQALFRRGRGWLGAGDWAEVLTPELRTAVSERSEMGAMGEMGAPNRARRALFADHFTRRQFDDLSGLLLPSLLRYEDRNSMAFSIEARVPFLDYRVVEFAFALPPAAKFDHGLTKRVLREAMAGIVPAPILARTDKLGFETPVVRWLLTRHAGWLRDVLVGGRAVEAGFIDRRRVERVIEREIAHPQGPGHEVWRLVSLELWLRSLAAGEAVDRAAAAARHQG